MVYELTASTKGVYTRKNHYSLVQIDPIGYIFAFKGATSFGHNPIFIVNSNILVTLLFLGIPCQSSKLCCCRPGHFDELYINPFNI
jgi:hypothetical protein